MSIFRLAKRLSGRWLDSQGYCGVRDVDEPQRRASLLKVPGIGPWELVARPPDPDPGPVIFRLDFPRKGSVAAEQRA